MCFSVCFYEQMTAWWLEWNSQLRNPTQSNRTRFMTYDFSCFPLIALQRTLRDAPPFDLILKSIQRNEMKFINKWFFFPLPYFASHRNTICAPQCAHRYSTSPIFTINLPISSWKSITRCFFFFFFDLSILCHVFFLSVPNNSAQLAVFYPVQDAPDFSLGA